MPLNAPVHESPPVYTSYVGLLENPIVHALQTHRGLGLALVGLVLLLSLLRFTTRHRGRCTIQSNWSATRSQPSASHTRAPTDPTNAMEKGSLYPAVFISREALPLPSACDMLKPLSHGGVLPSSGAVAAQVLKLKATEKASPSSPQPETETSPPARMEPDLSHEIGSSLQERSEVLQQMCEEDQNGVRTWRRLVMEYW
ncbi:hypothetical protein N7539_002431 [Penicillium diatomitis]|uniref:Uncharacterized protein n=1 Tax=Penicillium diatomitis TaxID=2819901 RepID=A0A9W9XET1_9EURO|nr:uncharacterized protein N7539_002431 [Penicillium diatomitis]KAJ5490864.1 hypothetical protein N7539_002431 [Penicillium diatomitis]